MSLQAALFATPQPSPPPAAHPYTWAVQGTGRRARLKRCRACRAITIRGLDEDVCAFDATVDVTPLSALGEVLATLADRMTYQLRATGTTLELERRVAHIIAGHPVGSGRFDVVPQHRCHTPPLPSTPSLITPLRTIHAPDAPPPF